MNLIGFFIAFTLFFAGDRNQKEPDAVSPVPEQRKQYFAGNLLGYVKSSGSYFPETDGCNLTNLITEVRSSTRTLGQVALGDVILQADGVTPVDGGDFWWGFTSALGGTPVRSIKINSSGVVIQISVCVPMVPFAYLSTTFTANCSNTGYTIALYTTPDDLTMYEGKQVFLSPGGQTLDAGSYTASSILGGFSVWTFAVVGLNSSVVSLTCCSTNPVANAGPDALYTLPSPTINLIGFGADCDGSVSSYAWSQISGPNTATFTAPTNQITSVTGVVAGTYVFQLQATDNASNTGTDQVTITVVDPPLLLNPVPLIIHEDMVYGLSDQDEKGVYGTSYNWVDGPWTPQTGNFDFDPGTPGVQGDRTIGNVRRITHNFYTDGDGSDLAVLIEFDSVMYFDRAYWLDSTGSSAGNIKVYIGDKTKMKYAFWQDTFGILAPDHILASGVGRVDSSLNWRDTGQYIMLLVENFNIDIRSIQFVGGPSPHGTKDTSITRKRWITQLADTSLLAKDVSAINFTGAPPFGNNNYVADSLKTIKKTRGYSVPINGTLGNFDPDPVPYLSSNTSTNRIDLQPYVNGVGANLFEFDSTIRAGGRSPHIAFRGANGLLFTQNGNQVEYKGINDITSNPRLRRAYDRRRYVMAGIVAILGNNPMAVDTFRYMDRRWPTSMGMGLYTTIELDNEIDEGYRGLEDNQYMSPAMRWAFQDICYKGIKAVAPNMTVYSQGYAAKAFRAVEADIKVGQLWWGETQPFFDVVSMHTTVNYERYNHTPTTQEQAGNHGDWPGRRNEGQEVYNGMLSISQLLGYSVKSAITEYAATKDSIGPTDEEFGTDYYISSIGAPQVKQYHKDTNHAINVLHQRLQYHRVPGIQGLYYYALMDAAGTLSIYYINADGSPGWTNYIDNPRKIFPLYYIMQGFDGRFGEWRWDSTLVADSMGTQVDRWVRPGTDSVMYAIANSDREDGTIPYVLDVGGQTVIRNYTLDFGSFNAPFTTMTVTDNSVSLLPRPEYNFIVFLEEPEPPEPPPPPPGALMRLITDRLKGIFKD